MDGDQLVVVSDPLLISVAERNLKKYDVVPLLYELGKASPHKLNSQEFFRGLKRAHDYSGIGVVSNNLTKLWNKETQDRYVAAILTYYNNLVIDAAKTGYVNGFENYPEINKRVNRATGGKNGKMPWFFQYSKNGRKHEAKRTKYAKPNASTMNRLCAIYNDVRYINTKKADVPPFNWQMLLMSGGQPYQQEAVEDFCMLDEICRSAKIEMQKEQSSMEKKLSFVADAQMMQQYLIDKYGSLENIYPSITKYLFVGEQSAKASGKQMFWKIFGDIACRILLENLQNATICENCGMKIPSWTHSHDCPKDLQGFFECVDCGFVVRRENSRQCRCADCQKLYRKATKNKYRYKRKE